MKNLPFIVRWAIYLVSLLICGWALMMILITAGLLVAGANAEPVKLQPVKKPPVVFMTGNDLQRRCTRQYFAGPSALCKGFATAMADVLSVGGYICLPSKRVTDYQLADIVLKELEGFPEDRHLPAVSFARDALITAFPCRKQQVEENIYK